MVLSVELYNLRVPAAKNFLLDSYTYQQSSRPFLRLLRNCKQASVVSYCWQKVKRLNYVNLETNAVEETHVEFIRLTMRWYKIDLSLFYTILVQLQIAPSGGQILLA